MSPRHACLALLVLAGRLSAQTMTDADRVVMAKTQAAQDAGRYLEAEALLRPLATRADENGFVRQVWEEAKGRMGGDRPLHAARPLDDEDRADLKRIAGATARDAIAEIVAPARMTRVVILNENHGEPRNRAFALAVARALHPLGYDVLAAETFGNDPDPKAYAASMTTLARDGYVPVGLNPVSSIGFGRVWTV